MTRALTREPADADAAKGSALRTMLLAAVGTGWIAAAMIYSGLAALGGALTWLPVGGAATGIALSVAGAAILRRARPLGGSARARAARRGLIAVDVAQVLAIQGAILACTRTGNERWIAPAVALIVGLHFFPLAPLLRSPLSYATGAAICLLAIATVCVVPAEFAIGARGVLGMPRRSIAAWPAVIGFGTGAILLLDAAASLLRAQARLRRALAAAP